nr:hypothetical protein [Desulfosporosinus youngiae]
MGFTKMIGDCIDPAITEPERASGKFVPVAMMTSLPPGGLTWVMIHLFLPIKVIIEPVYDQIYRFSGRSLMVKLD